MNASKKDIQRPPSGHHRKSDDVVCPEYVTNKSTGVRYHRMELLGAGGFKISKYFIYSNFFLLKKH